MARNVSGVWANSAGPMKGRSERPGMLDRAERHDGRRRRDVRQREAIDEIGERGRKQRDADAGDVLRQAERHGQQREQQPDCRAGERRDQHAGPQIGAEIDAHPSGHRAGREDALDAEIEHARALAQQCAEHAEHVRRRNADRGGPEARGEQDVEHAVHLSAPGCGSARTGRSPARTAATARRSGRRYSWRRRACGPSCRRRRRRRR